MTVLPLNPALPEPPFEQLRTQIARRAADGDLPAGTKLPTVRALAEQLGLAANTVARAYKELEADGVVVTEGRRGTFVAAATGAEASHDVQAAAAELATAARRSGLTLAQTQRLLDAAWAGPQSART
ncbi:GntR family transcriptional regulator [Nocardioides sp.]|uniref:GntR family transcriptional regulator n=1 Tax=Nocardioides sp. TaxID=35761 RepID=UPI00286A0FA0|nr:GntR family transcriptional regulator [Nocardioides sp.]